ncbi:MAG: bifunctional oligoribonuclease/PAP phosphatase NrnA [Ureaplasma sp.]|nr:bifunctional oligoribonuclease/PAP phosphatase NrnA [Ureaplasma sp.]
MKDFAKKLIDSIKNHKNILLFVHIHPDFDAIGSAFAFKKFIELNFLNKDVRIAGMDKLDTSYLSDFFIRNWTEVDSSFANDATCIVFDTANYERIYQKNLFHFENSFRIDHHLIVEKICQNEFVVPTASSTCELVGLLFQHFNLKIDSTIANSLYFGLLTDTIRFLTSNVNTQTYLVMAYLNDNAKIDKQLVHNQLYLRNWNDTKFDFKLSKKIKFSNGFAWLMFSNRFTKKYGSNYLKTKLYLMSNIKEIKVYALLYFDEISGFYRCSLRSREYDINKIAIQFSGGGHIYASGCKINDKNEFKILKEKIINLISSKNES